MSFGYQILGFGAGGGAGPWMEAEGGTLVNYSDGGTDYAAHYFLATGSFVATIGTEPEGDKVDYFVIAAGGGGGNHIGGGAGAGGAVTTSGLGTAITNGTWPVTIAGTTTGGGGDPTPDGTDSVVFVGAPFAATGDGGGGGAYAHGPGNPGGCGGGTSQPGGGPGGASFPDL